MKNLRRTKIKKSIMLATAGVIALSVFIGQTFAESNTTAPGTATTPTTSTSAPADTSKNNSSPNSDNSTNTNTNANTNNSVDLSKTTINEILVSDTPNKQGYVLQNSKNQIPASADKIYATVEIGGAVSNMKVMATLIYDQDGSQIGPVGATVDTTADTTMVPFSFTTTTPPWLKGNYTVQVSIGNNITKEYHFSVN